MDRIYRGFEASLLGIALCLGLAACLSLGTPRAPAGETRAITLPTLSVTAAR